MSADHQCLSLDGEPVGDLVSVGSRVTFFTVRRELRLLDGRIFRSIEDVRSAVRATLDEAMRRSDPTVSA
jgi:hypothetical protein